MFQWYSDKDEAGSLTLIASTTATNSHIRAGGKLILQEEQDSHGSYNFDIIFSQRVSQAN